MLEKPDLPDEKITACLQREYGLMLEEIAFLPLGADPNTAVYCGMAKDGSPYFVKLRSGFFKEVSVALPKFLSEQGIGHIISPIATQTGRLWASLEAYKVILYPFVEGRDGYEVELSDRHWRELGATLKKVHIVAAPAALARRIQQETYPPQWREIIKTHLERLERVAYDDPVAAELAAFLKDRGEVVLGLVGRAERLALRLRARSPESVLCHADVHAGNVLIGADGALYIVDWDDPIFARKERDLMSIGGSLFGDGRTAQEEEALFYQGYGQTQIDVEALAYYRYERIIQDIAVYCEQIFLTDEGGEDRKQSLHYLKSNFLPDGTIEMAYRADQMPRGGKL